MRKSPVLQWLLVLAAVAVAGSVGASHYLEGKVSQQAPPRVRLNSRHSGNAPLSVIELPPKGYDVFPGKGNGTLCGIGLSGQRGVHFDIEFADAAEWTVLEVAATNGKPQPNEDGIIQLSGRTLFRIERAHLWEEEKDLGEVATPGMSIRLTVTESDLLYVNPKGRTVSFPLHPPLENGAYLAVAVNRSLSRPSSDAKEDLHKGIVKLKASYTSL